jgi:hypothetical protein
MDEVVEFTPPVMSAGVMLEGFRLATERYHAAMSDPDYRRMLLALFEALNWATALDDRLKDDWKHSQPKGVGVWPEGFTHRDTIRGLRYVRARVHHQWAAAIYRSWVGAPYPPVRDPEWRWLPAQHLLPPPPKHRHFRDEYDWQLAAEPVRDTLGGLDECFSEAVTALELTAGEAADRS